MKHYLPLPGQSEQEQAPYHKQQEAVTPAGSVAMSSAKKPRHSDPTPEVDENGSANGHPSAIIAPRCTYSPSKAPAECPHVMVSGEKQAIRLHACMLQAEEPRAKISVLSVMHQSGLHYFCFLGALPI